MNECMYVCMYVCMYATIYWDRVAPSSGSNDASDADSDYNTYVTRIL